MDNKTNEFLMKFEPMSLQEFDGRSNEIIKVPITQITALGAVFAPMAEQFGTVANTLHTGSGEILYRALSPEGNPVKLNYMVHDGIGFSSMYSANGSRAIARMQEVGPTATIPCNPATLMVAVALVEVTQKLDDIAELQQKMYDFLQDDKHAKLKGNLVFLMDTFKNFKSNCTNEAFRTASDIKALDIKQESLQNIMFYRSQIEKTIDKNSLFIHDKSLKSMTESLVNDFSFYRLALYSFAFSSFMDIMLGKNYDPKFLKNTSDAIENYMVDYRKLYTDCYNKLEKDSGKSIQTELAKGVGFLSKTVGKAVAKTPLISKSQLDENLIAAGKYLQMTGEEKTDKPMDYFASVKDDFVRPFVNNIKLLNKLYSKPHSVAIDRENIYLVA